MRKIDFVEPETRSWKSWRQQCVRKTNACKKAVARGDKPTFSKLYSDQKGVFADAFAQKCAYCEQYVTSNQPGDIEHYRPKGQPCDLNWIPVVIKRGRKIIPHPGYYWLAYDFCNLLLACGRCNTTSNKRKFGKGERFPISGIYAKKPGGEGAEFPLLLNPLLDNPAEHLKIDESGVMSELSERGKVTIEVFGLNEFDRPDHRRECYRNIVNLINLTFTHEDDWDESVLEIFCTSKEYTFARRAAYDTTLQRFLNKCLAPNP